MFAENLLPGMLLDLEGTEYFTDPSDIAMAEYQLAEVEFIRTSDNGVLVHFTEHTSLFVPYGFTFTIAKDN